MSELPDKPVNGSEEMIPFLRCTFRVAIFLFALQHNVIRPRDNGCQDKFAETCLAIRAQIECRGFWALNYRTG
jgi:hypothetical protein